VSEEARIPGLRIRREQPLDRDAVYALQAGAFGRSGEADLVDALREATRPQLSLVAEVAGVLVGHVFFSPVTIDSPTQTPPCAGLAPLGVRVDSQGRGVGTALVEAGLAECPDFGWEAVFLVGAPAYYERFGFTLAAPRGFRYQSDLFDSVFQVVELAPGALEACGGEVFYHEAFDEVEG
jgi:putative acetyltransferase